MPIIVNRAPVMTLWAAVIAERLGHPADTALTLGRAVASSAARVKARNIGRKERKADRDADTPRLHEEHVTAPVLLLGKTVRLRSNTAAMSSPPIANRYAQPTFHALTTMSEAVRSAEDRQIAGCRRGKARL